MVLSKKLSGVNFINILRTLFCTKVLCAAFLQLRFGKIKVVFDQVYDRPLDENRNVYLQDVDDANLIPYDDDTP